MFNGPVFNNEVVQANSRAVNNAGFSESLDEANSLYSRLTGASFELVPSSYKGGVVYSGVPNTGNGDITWTRGSDARRTNADGLIQRVPWNLLQYSEVFTISSWTKTSVTASGNTTIAPDGNLTADTLSVGVDGVSVRHRMNSSSFNSQVIGTTYTSTYYLKANEHQWIQILGNIGYSTGVWANFDLVNGVVGNTGGTDTTASIENVGNGWYRCRVSGVATGTTTTGFEIIVINNTNGGRYPSYQSLTAADVCYVWGAQLVEGSNALPYFPTTDRLNVPRLSYMYGSAPALLLEPQRTNVLKYSEQFDSSDWGKNNVTVTSNLTIAPDGQLTGDLIVPTTFSGEHTVVGSGMPLAPVATAETYSVFVKPGGYSFVGIRVNISSTWTTAFFNVLTGTVVSAGAGLTASIVPAANGWFRCILTYSNRTANGVQVIPSNNGSSVSFIGDGTSGVYLWGAQAESGSFATTYIPTTTTSVTRLADSFTRNNIYTNGLITAAGGTWFVELRNNISYTRDAGSTSLAISTTSADVFAGSTGIEILANTGLNRLSVIKRISGTATTLYLTTTDTVKIAVKWNGTSVDVFVNGIKQASASSFTTTNMEFLKAFGVDVPKFIQQMTLFPTSLSDDQCVALTSDFTEGESVIGSYERYVNSNGGAVENLNTITNLIQNLK